jgi:hypothetical protein
MGAELFAFGDRSAGMVPVACLLPQRDDFFDGAVQVRVSLSQASIVDD